MPSPYISINKYIEYFRQLAANHTLVAHNIAQEALGADATEKGTQSFHILTIEDVLASERSDINPDKVNVLLYRYDIQPSDQNRVQDYRALYTGAFTVVQYTEVDNITAQHQAAAQTEIVAWDFIQSIIAQSAAGADGKQCASPFGIIHPDNFTIKPIGPIWEHCFGWHVEFNFKIDAEYWMDQSRVNQNLINP